MHTSVFYGILGKIHVREERKKILESKLTFQKALYVLSNSLIFELFSEKIVTDRTVAVTSVAV